MNATSLMIASLWLVAVPAHAEDIDLPLTPGTYVAAGEACTTADETKRITYWAGDNGFNIAGTTCKARGLRVTEDSHFIFRQKCLSPNESDMKLVTMRFTLPSNTRIRMDNVTYRYCGKPVKA